MEKLSRNLKTIGIHWKQYVEVKERILALVENNSPYSIETDYQYFPESAMWVVKAKLTMIESGEVFTGLAQEKESDGNINKTSALENAETSAVGRACAFAWIGIVDGIASVDEINKANNRTVTTENEPEEWFKDENLIKMSAWTYSSPDEAVKLARQKYKVSKQSANAIRHFIKTGEVNLINTFPKD